MNKKIMIGVLGFLIAAGLAQAAPLSAERNTGMGVGNQIVLSVYTNVHIYAGAMLAVNSSGYAIPAANASGNVTVGRAEKTVDNTAGATGAYNILGRSGAFYWDGDASVLTKAAIGQIAYVVDDHTVSITNSGSYKIIAGIIQDYDSVKSQVLVDTHNFAAAGASAPTTLAVSGAATVGTSLGVGTSMTVGSTLGVTGIISGPGSGITGLTAANVGTVSGASAVTNLVIGPTGTTNTMVLYPFGGGYIIKSFAP